jgi:catechol 2,3-dioxygenase-like lactoylglutathione lyase family enzyme
VNRSRLRSRRLGAILATAAFTIVLMPGLATGANSRSLFIGSPDAVTNDGVISSSPVTVPDQAPAPSHLTTFDVQIKSIDNQTLAHTTLTITIADYAGLSLNTYTQQDSCDDAATPGAANGGRIITCDFGNVEAFGQRTVSVLVNVASAYIVAGQPTTLFSAVVTTNNENGSNQQTFTATSGPFPNTEHPNLPPGPGFQVGAHSDDALSTYVTPGNNKHFFTHAVGGENKLQTTIDFVAANGETVAVVEGTTAAGVFECPSTLGCQPFYSQVTVGDGAFEAAPYFSWKLVALVPKTYILSQGFVRHYDSLTHSDWILYFKDKSVLCGTDTAGKIAANGGCLSGAPTLSKPVNGFATLTVTVVMAHQGGMKY